MKFGVMIIVTVTNNSDLELAPAATRSQDMRVSQNWQYASELKTKINENRQFLVKV